MNYNVNKAKADLDKIQADKSLYDRMLEVAAIITKLMASYVKEDDQPIIVGGLSLEIYTDGEYTTHDIDFVSSASILLKEKLKELGFTDNQRIFQYPRLNVAIDIVDDVLDPPDYEKVNKIELEPDSFIFVQSPSNILYDRVLDYERQDNIKYGIFLIATRYDEINFDYVRKEVKKVDSEALKALEEWIDIALNNHSQ